MRKVPSRSIVVAMLPPGINLRFQALTFHGSPSAQLSALLRGAPLCFASAYVRLSAIALLSFERPSTQGMANIIAQFRRDAGIERHVTPHMLRHTVATLLLRNGVDIRVVREFLGYASIATLYA
jgi:integrase